MSRLMTSAAGGGGGIGDTFTAAAGAEPEPERDLTQTALYQIDLREEHEAEQRRHDQRLIAMKHNLAAGDICVPSYDLGPNTGRDLKGEYETRYTEWQLQGDAINLAYEGNRDTIRENGVTLVNAFEETQRSHSVEQDQIQMTSHKGEQAYRDQFADVAEKTAHLDVLMSHRDALMDVREGVQDLGRDAKIVKSSDPYNEQAVDAFQDRLSSLKDEAALIDENFAEKEAQTLEAPTTEHLEPDISSFNEIAPHDFENDLSREMREALNEDVDHGYWLDDAMEGELDFEVSPEQDRDYGHANYGVRSRR